MTKIAFVIIAFISFGVYMSAGTTTIEGVPSEVISNSDVQKSGVTAVQTYKGYFQVTNNNDYTVKVSVTIYAHTNRGKVEAGKDHYTLKSGYAFFPCASLWRDDIIKYSIEITSVQRVYNNY